VKTEETTLTVEVNPDAPDKYIGARRYHGMSNGWRLRVLLPSGRYAYEIDNWVLVDEKCTPPYRPPRKSATGPYAADGFEQVPGAMAAYDLIVAAGSLLGYW
jgi:hypothetical protein